MARTVFHVDVNSAFLSWSAVQMLRNGYDTDLRLIPSAIGGDEEKRKGIVLAKSIPAKKYGVITGEPLWQARKKCPELVIVPANYGLYSRMSSLFTEIIDHEFPVWQKYSVDECFIDCTGMEGIRGDPIQSAEALRSEIKERLGFTVSIGVSSCKVLAKMAGELKKPDAVSSIFPYEVEKKLWPLPVDELFMVGRSTARALNLMGISQIGDLAKTDPEIMKKRFGKHGLSIWLYANGIDQEPVVSTMREEPKSCSQSVTLPHDMSCEKDIIPVISRLCAALAYRLRRLGKCCCEVTVFFKDDKFVTVSKQQRLFRPTDISGELFEKTRSLFRLIYDGRPIRALGIGFSALTPKEGCAFTLFDDPANLGRKFAIDAAADSVRSRFGGESLLPASALISPTFEHLKRFEPNEGHIRTVCPF